MQPQVVCHVVTHWITLVSLIPCVSFLVEAWAHTPQHHNRRHIGEQFNCVHVPNWVRPDVTKAWLVCSPITWILSSGTFLNAQNMPRWMSTRKRRSQLTKHALAALHTVQNGVNQASLGSLNASAASTAPSFERQRVSCDGTHNALANAN